MKNQERPLLMKYSANHISTTREIQLVSVRIQRDDDGSLSSWVSQDEDDSIFTDCRFCDFVVGAVPMPKDKQSSSRRIFLRKLQ